MLLVELAFNRGGLVHAKAPAKTRFRVNRQWLVMVPRENEVLQLDDCVDFSKEEEAIGFMFQEKGRLDFLGQLNVVERDRYFWSIKEGKPYKKYLGFFLRENSFGSCGESASPLDGLGISEKTLELPCPFWCVAIPLPLPQALTSSAHEWSGILSLSLLGDWWSQRYISPAIRSGGRR